MKYYLDNSDLPTLDPKQAQKVAGEKLMDRPAKLVVRGYYPDQHQYLVNYGLEDKELLNMYDVFQHATDVEWREVPFRYNPSVDKTRYHLEGIDWGLAQARRHGTTYGRPVIDIETFAGMPAGRSSMLHYLDKQENIAATDIWDYRGFKSATRYYQNNGNPTAIVFYTPEGKIAARASFMWQHIEGKPNNEWPLVQTSLEVMDYDGQHLWFENEMHAYEYFLQHEAEKAGVVLVQPEA